MQPSIASTHLPFKRQGTVPVWSEKELVISKSVLTCGSPLLDAEQFGLMHNPDGPSSFCPHMALEIKKKDENVIFLYGKVGMSRNNDLPLK